MRIFMFCKLIKYFWIFSWFTLINFWVLELFMNRLSKKILILFSLLLFLLCPLLMRFFFFFSDSLHIAVYELFPIWFVNTCSKSLIFLQSVIEYIKRNWLSFLFSHSWFVIFFCMVHKFDFWLEEFDKSLSQFISCSLSKFCLIWLRRVSLRIFL